ncbi:nicotinamide mononucleotide transporter [Bifidobacterium bohemicum]|uniref:Putative Nicotinamide mononucleotide transporter n=1 Tax=Bifidobacterium bohemicum DSM 22767 TaxID=1437606 RepID=A0A086ZH50_9BIFI|nr:nicotinamide mononucleotide transporter [Bifidobacterium bohemicum]KFI45850.1 putative Nicotinamide mononucleotide transporter [Bifidobacterium bohemicum DSM 22767]SCC15520.1 nicotinamide mononucleotide transporter [Bifidobacterium bohemicum]
MVLSTHGGDAERGAGDSFFRSSANALDRLAHSVWFTLLGVAIVVFLAWRSGYMLNSLGDYPVPSALQALGVTSWGFLAPLAFGLISTLSSVLSLLSTRLTASMRNAGNWIGVFQAVLAGLIDWVLGNQAAWLTYPVSFLLEAAAVWVWARHSDRGKARKAPQGRKAVIELVAVLVVSGVFSLVANLLGYEWQVPSGSKGVLFWLLVFTFALSMASNAINVLKLTVQWPFWAVYNLGQLSKAAIQGNWANVGKYVYYIINSVAGLAFWSGRDPGRDSR